jgi:hypothetical protein
MHIFNSSPSTWQELQNMVGQLFTEVGYTVEVSTVINLVRGQKEIDVYVHDHTSEYGTTFLIECKFWNGFIVSKNGFQKGSYEAAEKTNIKLVSLEELEERFLKKWQVGMARKYMPLADRLFPYWEMYGGKQPQKGKLDWDTHQLLNRAYQPYIHLGPGDQDNFRERIYPDTLPVLDDSFQITGQITLNNDRNYFDFIAANAEKSLRHYQLLYHEI